MSLSSSLSSVPSWLSSRQDGPYSNGDSGTASVSTPTLGQPLRLLRSLRTIASGVQLPSSCQTARRSRPDPSRATRPVNAAASTQVQETADAPLPVARSSSPLSTLAAPGGTTSLSQGNDPNNHRLADIFRDHAAAYAEEKRKRNKTATSTLTKDTVLGFSQGRAEDGPCGTLEYQSKLWDTVSDWAQSIKAGCQKFRINESEAIDVSDIDLDVFTAASYHLTLDAEVDVSRREPSNAVVIDKYSIEKEGSLFSVARGGGILLEAGQRI